MDNQVGLYGRDAVARFVAEHPGIHHRAIARGMRLAIATVHHHLLNLVAEGRVVAHRDGRYVRYFDASCPPEAKVVCSLLGRDVPGRVLRSLAPLGRATARDLAEACGMREATVTATMTRLHRHGVVVRERVGARYVYALEATPARILQQVETARGPPWAATPSVATTVLPPGAPRTFG